MAIRSTPRFGAPIGLGESGVAIFRSGARSRAGFCETGWSDDIRSPTLP